MINITFPDSPAIITREQTLRYADLQRGIDHFAHLFENSKGDKVALCASNSPEWIFAFYAIWANNKTAVPIDAGSSVDDLAYILRDCEPGVIFCGKAQLETMNQAIKLWAEKPQLIVMEDVPPADSEGETEVVFPSDTKKTAVILYTSGTTGEPKGVMLSFANLIANVKGVSEDVEIFTHERQVLALLPLHHIFPLAGCMLAPLYAGGSIVMTPSMQSADIMELLAINRVNIMIGVPRFYELLFKGIEAKIRKKKVAFILFRMLKKMNARGIARRVFKKVHQGLGGHLEIMVSGGAALNPEVGSFFYALGFKMLEGFGMTEAAPMITFTRPDHIRIGSAGQALPGLSVEIHDGEIVAKGPNIMQGYYNRPEETASTLRDGWLHTGDIGELDANGFLKITGRIKEIIVLPNGKNISPVELEAKIGLMSPYLKEVAVMMYQDVLHAILVPDENLIPDDLDLQTHLREDLMPRFNKGVSAYKQISRFTIYQGELPRTRLGKIQRYRLEALIAKPTQNSRHKPAPAIEEYKKLKEYIEQMTERPVQAEDHLYYDIALDSLGRISLIDFIEISFGLSVSENDLQKFGTLLRLSEFVHLNKKFQKSQEQNWAGILNEEVNLKLPRSWPTVSMMKDTAKGLFTLYFRFSGKGQKDIPEGPCIITPNHQSFFDGLFVASFLKNKTLQKTYFFAKEKHVNTRLLKFVANRNNVIVVDTQNDLKESLQKMAEVLRAGKKIIMFPEGTRSKNGSLGEFKKTFAILSKELNVPVIPVAINGAYKALPSGAIFPRPFARVQVEFLNAIYPLTQSYENIKEQVMQMIKSKVKG